MNRFKIIFFISLLLLQSLTHAQSRPKVKADIIKLVFHAMVGNLPLQLDSSYTTPLGDTFSVSKFKFFVGDILFTNYGSAQKQFDDYFLIDENDSANQTITLQVQDQPYTNLEFCIGVDSAKNVSGVQTGALDPANGMFWTWNSGYIMAKLEGRSPQSKAPFGNITYHIGGFREQDNVVRKISLDIRRQTSDVRRESSVVSGSLDNNIVDNSDPIKNDLKVGAPSHDSQLTSHDSRLTSHVSRFTLHETTINIDVDLNKWFDGPHPIKISGQSFCMSPGKMAMEIADNYAHMFSIKSIIAR